ncbi:MAG TPA: hypothetical protein VHE55_09655 [Fimbriimonadaceae bacterium]|nr:hypothetical protein [Fimbriimonadaceae bacterium]
MTGIKRFIAAKVPSWWPEDVNKAEALLLTQMGVGLCLIVFLAAVETIFLISGRTPSLPSRGILGVVIAWAFALVAAPIGIFSRKPWGHFLEIGVSIPMIALGVLLLFGELNSSSRHIDFVEGLVLAYIAFRSLFWLIHHFKTGLLLRRLAHPTTVAAEP